MDTCNRCAWGSSNVSSVLTTIVVVLLVLMLTALTASAIAATAATATASPPPLPLSTWIDFSSTQYQRAFTAWAAQPSQLPLAAKPTASAWGTTSTSTWTPGFFPASFWQLYHALGTTNTTWAKQAALIQQQVAHRANDTSTHDVGFIIFNTYALGYELTGDASFLPVIRDAALSLASRFSPIVGCTRSWNSDEGFLVVIDNMMNIELLFWAAAQFNNQTWHDMAYQHANRTMYEHFRPDHSTYHVVEYNETDGSVVRRYTAQGYADWSTWARGQSWAIYGFATAYQYTTFTPFLDAAVAAADLYLQRLEAEVSDSVPYWDFDAPHTNVSALPPRDTSSAAAAALGLIRLSQLGVTRADEFVQRAALILGNLSSPAYAVQGHDEYPLPALLTQSVGSFPGNEQVDDAIVFADFYYLRAINAYAALESGLARDQEVSGAAAAVAAESTDSLVHLSEHKSSIVSRLGRHASHASPATSPAMSPHALQLQLQPVSLLRSIDASPSVDVAGMFKFAGVQYTRVYDNWLLNEQDYPNWGYPTNTTWTPTSPVQPFESGFFGGVLWHLYEWNRVNDSNTPFLAWAQQVQVGNAPVANVTWSHDVGFVIMATYGMGYELTQNVTYLPVIEQAARSLATRYSPIVHCTRSWNNNTDFWVIIDNMMNIELLYWAGQQFGNETWSNMAWQHTNRTMFEHFREDNSTWHVVEYNDTTGAVVRKHTAQGYADWSTWARGQSWAIYGFTMAYRYTQYQPFLDKAVGAAQLFLRRLGDEVDDWVPYWDFDAPYEKQWEPRDSSAAAVTASGLFELSTHVTDANLSASFYSSATSILASLSSYNYSLNGHAEYKLPALLAHGTGNYPAHKLIDVSLCYGEYYYMQALTRYAASLNGGGRKGIVRTLMGNGRRGLHGSVQEEEDVGDDDASVVGGVVMLREAQAALKMEMKVVDA